MSLSSDEFYMIFFAINCSYLEQNLPNAQLILYPNTSHDSLFQ
jgi:hypothetical protein